MFNENASRTPDGTDVAERTAYAAPHLTILGSVEKLTLGGEGCDVEPVVGGFFGDASPC